MQRIFRYHTEYCQHYVLNNFQNLQFTCKPNPATIPFLNMEYSSHVTALNVSVTMAGCLVAQHYSCAFPSAEYPEEDVQRAAVLPGEL